MERYNLLRLVWFWQRLMGDKTGVRIGVLCPDLVLTDLTKEMKQREEHNTLMEKEEEHIRMVGGWTPYVFNTLRPRQNGRHFSDDIFRRTSLNENIRISSNISLNSVSYGLIHYKHCFR